MNNLHLWLRVQNLWRANFNVCFLELLRESLGGFSQVFSPECYCSHTSQLRDAYLELLYVICNDIMIYQDEEKNIKKLEYAILFQSWTINWTLHIPLNYSVYECNSSTTTGSGSLVPSSPGYMDSSTVGCWRAKRTDICSKTTCCSNIELL